MKALRVALLVVLSAVLFISFVPKAEWPANLGRELRIFGLFIRPDIANPLARRENAGPVCYPNSPVKYDAIYPGWDPPNQSPSYKAQGREVDEKVMALYRDILQWSIRRVDVWAVNAQGRSPSGCGRDGEWLGMGSAFLIDLIDYDGQRIAVWITADHIAALEEYLRGQVKITHLKVNSADAIILPRQKESGFRIGVLITPYNSFDWPIPLTDRWKFGNGWRSMFLQSQSLKVGEKVYQTYTTLGGDCLPENAWWECIVDTPQVNAGTISALHHYEGKQGSYFTAQLDLMGGSSGSPAWVFVDNDDGRINLLDFKLIGVENVGWDGGNVGEQQITAADLDQIREALKKLGDIWKK